ncbi:hypothetical protein CPC735_008010 [Coccidioides posadasii C735 delta SOWgp]|uniref:CBF1-interacting co-repressor CIR N-terminal domain-containing protein n=1 Tax=Coccidioides posadasii (strain C735) TaxID=222929 RepID=C5PA66_COCP7|nr:hypothetical protein CPC735_008010 [Coccidioides posadasii C735 delta SOWgp]EER26628.1 hypothetical protein CPC735_008010 [Coccidioides posadasii C735 delta SOWgp]|eukprot:XP_003068773.1 hypothetical protein CPC735_008010 [Coccidioides posadasii C735 delta SOWgp]
MPLIIRHLLGKKSWNVYNRENIARVRRDEALAKDREEENERREQEVVAERRIDFLRNQRPTSPLSQQDFSRDIAATRAPTEVRHRKRRRLAGEDDTDRDIRLAREDVLLRAGSSREITSRKPTSNAPLVDSSGHISLFPRKADERPGKNDEAEAEATKAKREYEDQYTMRFSNAAGYKQGMEAPWYSTSQLDLATRTQDIPAKDVWGNEDPGRREREKMRIDANDPLAAMKMGVRQLRDVEKERKEWEEERKKELKALKRAEKESRRRRRRRSRSYNSLEDFKLDEDPVDEQKHKRKRRPHRSHRETDRPNPGHDSDHRNDRRSNHHEKDNSRVRR